MLYKSVCLGLTFGEITAKFIEETGAAENYSIAFCAREQAHLSVLIAAPVFDIPGAGLVPRAYNLVDEINAERCRHAEAAEKRITSAAASAGISVECQRVQQFYRETNDILAAAARASDIVIISRPTNGVHLDGSLIEALLFSSGRPVIVVPPYWDGGVEFDKILVAWDGSARAARAVGDSMPILMRAQQIEILCASPDAAKSVAGVDLATHLSRHCRNVTVNELEANDRDVGKTLRDHATTVGANLFVMGAYTHPHLWQMVLGGVTSDMLLQAELPVLLSY